MLFGFRGWYFRAWHFRSIFGRASSGPFVMDYATAFVTGPEHCEAESPSEFSTTFQSGVEHSEGIPV